MTEFEFNTREEASVAAAARLQAALERRLASGAEASLVISGGTTPGRCLSELSTASLDWNRVHAVLSDERWVATDSDDSNEKLARELLLRNAAAAARLHGVFRADMSVDERARRLDRELRLQPLPFACALLGMGTDGHFASLFPDADNLASGLDPDSPLLCIPVRTKASPHARISLTLSALSRSDEIVLLIFGAEKRDVLRAAKQSATALPVSRLLLQKRAPVNIYWAP
ncbi:6-phosphogluconolactonase [Woeseia oceani]|uniref:6-phosphogluconolactonase n=1 Tax=Woeseia oceani TaxID=1548547 RepID=A0A193LCL3_9GAMM|nr:6-phosphogluconolactonase [Woeseia oceani]ANO50134.1 6-phosphogluconolactonase [Woeseia oceani]